MQRRYYAVAASHDLAGNVTRYSVHDRAKAAQPGYIGEFSLNDANLARAVALLAHARLQQQLTLSEALQGDKALCELERLLWKRARRKPSVAPALPRRRGLRAP